MENVKFFQNHEIHKLISGSPTKEVWLLYGTLALLLLLSQKKISLIPFMGHLVTDQIRGISILLVVVGHIGVHLLPHGSDFLVLGQYGVSMFFVLSGYGLARSYSTKSIIIKEFVVERIFKLMIPYWFSTIAILCIDYIFLHRTYRPLLVILTFSGINLTTDAFHIDYVRWYITNLLIWYLLFGYSSQIISKTKIFVVLIACSFVMHIINYFVCPIGYAMFSFPVGVFIGTYFDNIYIYKDLICTKKVSLYSVVMFLLIVFFLEKCLKNMENVLPNLIISSLYEFGLVCSSVLALVFFSSWKNRTSAVFVVAGRLSYPIFLFHGVMMIRYDYILYRGPLWITFWIYLLMVAMMAALIQKIIFDPLQKKYFLFATPIVANNAPS